MYGKGVVSGFWEGGVCVLYVGWGWLLTQGGSGVVQRLDFIPDKGWHREGPNICLEQREQKR